MAQNVRRSMILTLVALSLLVPGPLHAAPPGPPGGITLAGKLPDLVIWLKGPTKPYITCDSKVLHLELLIVNIGTAKTTHAVKTLVKVDGAVWNSPNNPHTSPAEIPPGFNSLILMVGPSPPGPGMHTLWVKVDSENEVLELNESNNECTAMITCGTPSTATVTCGPFVPVGAPRPVEPPKLYPRPKIGPPPVEQPYVPPTKIK